MNLANKLTLGRIFMTFLFMIALVWSCMPCNYVVATVIFVLAWITDILDGIIARRFGQVTNFGKLIDPLSDKILMSAAFISFVQIPEISIPAWMVVVIVSREFIITGMRSLAATRGRVIQAGIWGKQKATTQMITVLLFLLSLCIQQLYPQFWANSLDRFFPTVKYIALYVTIALTSLSGILYLIEHRDILQSD
jgi:CDP-diacylglycerol---glycerol-3-phosphate 3-phosphatidyltransferase